jgi:hypothetical protein
VDSGNSVGAVRADDREIGHANLSRRCLFHQADTFDPTFIPGEPDTNFLEQPAVDLVNDLQLPRKKNFEPCRRPFLQGLRQKCVVGVRQRFPGQIPGCVPPEVRIVQQDAHQFSDRHRRMRVIELDGDLLGQLFPICVVA